MTSTEEYAERKQRVVERGVEFESPTDPRLFPPETPPLYRERDGHRFTAYSLQTRMLVFFPSIPHKCISR